MKRIRFVALFLLIIAIIGCKKDYHQLAIEFERALPDTMVVLSEQINEIDHFVFYKNKSNTELYRYNLETKTKDIIQPELDDFEVISGIYMGKENIIFLKSDGGNLVLFMIYNLKTQKFKEGDYLMEPVVDETDKTIKGYMEYRNNFQPPHSFVYDFDGNKISEEEMQNDEEETEYESMNSSSNEGYQKHEKPLQEFRCKKCGQRVAARNTIEAGIEALHGCEPAGSSHSWDYIQY